HQDDANISRHRHNHLSKALSLTIFFGGKIDVTQLGDAVDQVGNLIAKVPPNVFLGGESVFHHVMEQPGAYARGVEAKVSDCCRHPHRMSEIGLSALPDLLTMGRVAVMVCPANQRNVSPRMVSLYPLK